MLLLRRRESSIETLREASKRWRKNHLFAKHRRRPNNMYAHTICITWRFPHKTDLIKRQIWSSRLIFIFRCCLRSIFLFPLQHQLVSRYAIEQFVRFLAWFDWKRETLTGRSEGVRRRWASKETANDQFPSDLALLWEATIACLHSLRLGFSGNRLRLINKKFTSITQPASW